MRVTKDFIAYLENMDLLARSLEPERRRQLEVILESLLSLLVALKKSSGLGKVTYDFGENFGELDVTPKG